MSKSLTRERIENRERKNREGLRHQNYLYNVFDDAYDDDFPCMNVGSGGFVAPKKNRTMAVKSFCIAVAVDDDDEEDEEEDHYGEPSVVDKGDGGAGPQQLAVRCKRA
jgi:hypothetical protein